MELLWPDFTRDDLDKAIIEFNKRNRRFGGDLTVRMKQRVLTGIVGALLLLAVFMTFDTIFFNIAVLAAYFIALYEIYSAFKEQNVKALFLLLGIIGAYFVLLPYVPQVNNRLVIALLMGIYALITVASFDRIDFKTLSSSLMFGLYVLVGFASITYLKNILPTAEYGGTGYSFLL